MADRAGKKAKDAAMASYMKDRPGQFPDSVRKPHDGCGAAERKVAMTMGRVESSGRNYMFGMLGGVLAAKLGYGIHTLPSALEIAAE